MFFLVGVLGFVSLVVLNSAFVPQDSWTEVGKE